MAQSLKERPEVTEARSDHLPWTSQALKPGVPFSTRKPRILSSSVLAQTTATSASEPLVIHIFSPFRMYWLPFFTARVSMPLGFEPNCGSGGPKQPTALPDCRGGSHLSFCAACAQGGSRHIPSDPCSKPKPGRAAAAGS